ncbi:MAG: type IX secretion system membrane protein PorP/SprF [Bacteroidales bacterium]|nr:MAG: type IX secretion system membrane protein PorP/SprF [Bacteroidales bacterium]
MLKHLNRMVLVALIVLLSNIRLCAQDPSFSQLFFNHLYLNPAYAGASKYIRLGLVYRNQWMSAKMPYTTYGVSYDRTMQGALKSGIGINIINDVQSNGVLQRTSADFIYAYGVQTGFNSHVRGGIQASLIMKNRNFSNLTFPDMIDPDGNIIGSSGLAGSTNLMYDFSAGVAGDYDIFYGGLAVHHLFQPVENEVEGNSVYLPRKYTLHIGCEFNLYKWYRFKQKLLFSPNIIYIRQGEYQQLNLGAYFTRYQIVAGMWLRENLDLKSHTFVFTGGYSNDQFRFGYSYDFGVYDKGFRGLGTSTHEVTFGWNFEYKKGKKKFRYIKCPKF